MEYLSKSVYRFMAKMENLTAFEEEILKFLRRSFYIPRDKMKPELQKFLDRVKHFERNRFQTRVFVYLDWISWVESKVYNKPMYKIIHEKYLADKRSAPIEKKKLQAAS
jgi:hypothetical protein